MSIIIFLMATTITTLILGYVSDVITNAVRRKRDRKKFANLPKKVLLTYVLSDPVYSAQYHDMRQLIPDDRAADKAIKRMLTDLKCINYRKEMSS